MQQRKFKDYEQSDDQSEEDSAKSSNSFISSADEKELEFLFSGEHQSYFEAYDIVKEIQDSLRKKRKEELMKINKQDRCLKLK